MTYSTANGGPSTSIRTEHAGHFLFGRLRRPLGGFAEEAFLMSSRLVGHQHARVLGDLDERVRHSARQEDGTTSGCHEAFLTDLEAVVALQHMEELIVLRMEVQRWLPVG